MYERYAVYFTPTGALADLGSAWLGWDSATGRFCSHPVVPGIDVARITKNPRKYGLHATLKPPFRLSEGQQQDQLQAAFADLCATLKPVLCPELQVSLLGRFYALTAFGDTNAMSTMAAAVVSGLDCFRAPLTNTEIARRNPDALSRSKQENLFRWGYPHVMSDFRFHITLTDKLRKQDLQTVGKALRENFAPCLRKPLLIDHLTLCGEDENGRFYQITRLPMSGSGPLRE